MHIILLLLYLGSQFSFSFISEKTLLGYVYNVTYVITAKNETTKYFNFDIQSEEENYKCVSLLHEKNKLSFKYQHRKDIMEIWEIY